jgi:hypothetical protein
LIPGPGSICCVASVSGTGERMSGTTSTTLALRSPHGFITTSVGSRGTTFIGVLPASAQGLRIITRSARAIDVPVNEDDAYWTTVDDAIEMIMTLADGTLRHVPFSGSRNH